MPETLLTPSGIKLYGRILDDLQIKPGYKYPNPLGADHFLFDQLVQGGKEEPHLARIYAFSYEGHFYELARPAIFLVHGDGKPASPIAPLQKGKRKGGSAAADTGRGALAPGDVDESGVAAKGWDFMEDIMYWDYDAGDFSIRLDVEAGPLQQILLEAALGADGSQSYSGGARVSGARVSGARVSGARVSGARVSGARVGGGNTGD